MEWKTIIGIFITVLTAGIFYSCASSKVKRTVLFEGSKTYPWKIEYAQENHFPAGKSHYYEVFYNGTQLVIPREIFNSISDISKFTNANGFEIQHENNNAVLITIENIPKHENGFDQHHFISFFVAKINDGKVGATCWIYNLEREKVAEFKL